MYYCISASKYRNGIHTKQKHGFKLLFGTAHDRAVVPVFGI